MKKYLLLLSALVLFVTPTIANAGTAAVGFTIASNSIDTVGKEDVDNNGSIDDTKNVSDDIYTGSIFAEYTEIEGNLAITYGVDYIPFDADIDRRSISQSSLGDKASGAASTGTNSVSASVSDHLTLYLQPGYMMTPDSMLFATFGIVRADLDGKSTSLTHTDISSSKSLDGTKIGVGIKYTDSNSGLVFKIEASETEYDTATFVTSNNTKATADLDNTAVAISLGKTF